jgi:tetratricopeptide (TPR) repeat protein
MPAMPVTQTPVREERSAAWTVPLVLFLAFACYWPALRGGMLWDDDAHVTRASLQSVQGLFSIWTSLHATQQVYPLLHSAFWVEHLLWGDATLGYHLVNVLLHASAALLFMAVLRRLSVPGATLAGILFTVHPVCVESVAWISEQKNTLSLVLYLLAALAYLRFDERRGIRTYLLATLLFAAALLTKTVTATLPAALLVVFWWRRGTLSLKRDALPLLPWFGLSLAGATLTSWVEHSLIGAAGPEFSLTLAERVLLAGHNVWFYLGKLLWPSDLVFIYPHADVHREGLAWGACALAALMTTVLLFRLRRRARGPLAAWLLFVGGLFPALGFVNVYPFLFSYVADHFQYLASLPVFALAGAGASLLHNRLPTALRAPALVVASLLVGFMAILSTAQSRMYRDEGTLYTRTLEQNPDCWMARNNLGLWLEAHGRNTEALAQYEEALRIRPEYADAHNNLGSLLRQFPGREAEAKAHLDAALRIQPAFPEAANNLGVWYQDQGDLEHAAEAYRQAAHLRHDFATAYRNLGTVLLKTREGREEALAALRTAVSLDPLSAEAHDGLGTALLGLPGREEDAVAEYRTAVRLKPDFAVAYNNLGNALARSEEHLPEAVSAYEASLRLDPNSAETHNNLGAALVKLGRTDDAVSQYGEALRLKPSLAEIHFNIAMALLNTPGRRDEAVRHLEAFLEARPGNETAERILAQLQGR